MCSWEGKLPSSNSKDCTSDCRAETTAVNVSGVAIGGGQFATSDTVDNALIVEFLSEVESLITDTEYFTANSGSESDPTASSIVKTAGWLK